MENQRQLPRRIHAAVERMVSAAEADKLGAVSERGCYYRMKRDDGTTCHCAIGVQLPPKVLEKLAELGLMAASVLSIEAQIPGFSVFDTMGLTPKEAAALQLVHDDTYTHGDEVGLPRSEVNQMYIERLRTYAAGARYESGFDVHQDRTARAGCGFRARLKLNQSRERFVLGNNCGVGKWKTQGSSPNVFIPLSAA